MAAKIDIAVIGAGQAGLSSAFHLRRLGSEADKEFVIFDRSPGTGAPGNFAGPRRGEVQAWVAVLEYYEAYEKAFELRIHHPVAASIVCDRGERLRIETDAGLFSARGIVNAPGTWETSWTIRGGSFKGRQLHTKDYRTAEEFAGKHVVVVGAGISAIQLLDSMRFPASPRYVGHPPEAGIPQGFPPASIVSVTGIPLTPAIEATRQRGALDGKIEPKSRRASFCGLRNSAVHSITSLRCSCERTAEVSS